MLHIIAPANVKIVNVIPVKVPEAILPEDREDMVQEVRRAINMWNYSQIVDS